MNEYRNTRLIALFFIISVMIVSCHPAHASSGGYYAKAVDGFVRYDSDSDFYRTKAIFERNPGANSRAPARITRTVPYSAGGLKNLLKLKSLTPGGLALGAAATAAGYIWDAVEEDVITSSTGTTPYGQNMCRISGGNHPVNDFNHCRTAISNNFPGQDITNNSPYAWFDSYRVDIFANGVIAGWYWYPQSGNDGVIPYDESETISDQDFLDDVAPLIQWGDVAIDDSGSPITTPELTEILNNTNNWYDETYNDNRQTITTTSTSTTVINQDGTETTTGTEQQDLPAFCNWAGVLCDLADWITEDAEPPKHPDMPVENIDVSTLESNWSSGLGGGTCPAPIQLNAMGSPITLDMSSYCWVASNILYYILIFFSTISAGYIIAGVRDPQT